MVNKKELNGEYRFFYNFNQQFYSWFWYFIITRKIAIKNNGGSKSIIISLKLGQSKNFQSKGLADVFRDRNYHSVGCVSLYYSCISIQVKYTKSTIELKAVFLP